MPQRVQNTPIPTVANAADVPSVYANIIEMLSLNHIDVRFAFDEVIVESGNKATNYRRANVVMSVPAFLTMVQILQVAAQRVMEMGPESAAIAQAHLTAALKPKTEEK